MGFRCGWLFALLDLLQASIVVLQYIDRRSLLIRILFVTCGKWAQLRWIDFTPLLLIFVL